MRVAYTQVRDEIMPWDGGMWIDNPRRGVYIKMTDGAMGATGAEGRGYERLHKHTRRNERGSRAGYSLEMQRWRHCAHDADYHPLRHGNGSNQPLCQRGSGVADQGRLKISTGRNAPGNRRRRGYD